MIQEKQRLDWLDVAKGLGIIFVVLSHSQCSNLIWLMSACYVPVFFICSGYTMIRKKNQTYGSFIIQKAKRLLYPYFFCVTVIIAFNFVVDFVLSQPFDWFRSTIGVLYSRAMLYPIENKQNVLMLPMNTQPMWFLTSLYVALILTYLLLGCVRCKGRVVIMIFVMLVLAYMLTCIPLLLPWSLDTLPLFVLMILFGVQIREQCWINLPKYIYSLIFVFYLVILYFNGDINYSIREYGNSLLMAVSSALMGSLVLIKVSQWISKITWMNNLLSALGRHSLYIMCFHLPILTVGTKVIEILSFNDVFIYMLNFCMVIIAIGLCVILSILLQRYISFLR